MFDKLRERLAGVVSIPVTPFSDQDEVDIAALEAITHRMVSAGIDIVTPNGNTGEYYSLSAAERRLCLETASRSSAGASVLAGVGGSVHQAIEEARHARDHGAEGIMIHQPVHPYVSAAGWADYHARIAESVPELGMVAYLKTPQVTPQSIDRLSSDAPNFVGIKYALPHPVHFAQMVADVQSPDLVWVAGLAESFALSQFTAGATGFTSGLANVVPELSLRFHETLRLGNFQQAFVLWDSIRPFEDLRARNSDELNVSVVKDALEQLGLCKAFVRPPITTVPAEDRPTIARMLKSWQLETGAV